MLIPKKEAEFFISLYSSSIYFVANRLGGIEGIKDSKSFRNVLNEARCKARDKPILNTYFKFDFHKSIIINVLFFDKPYISRNCSATIFGYNHIVSLNIQPNFAYISGVP